MRTFTTELPEGYVEAAHIRDFQSGFRNDLKTVLPGILLILAGCVCVKLTFGQIIASAAIFIVSVYPYFVLHELTHAMVYKAATHQNIKIGFTKGGAYCSMPDIYVCRSVAAACTAAPLVLFTVLFGVWAILAIVLKQWYFLPAGLLMMLHLFGCRSDRNLLRELRKYKECDVLVRDNGAQQWIYRR